MADIDDFEVIDSKNNGDEDGIYDCLPKTIRLSPTQAYNIKDKIDKILNPDIKNEPITPRVQFKTSKEGSGITIKTYKNIHKRESLLAKLNSIPVFIEEIGGKVLVKVGPCDLSGFGGHTVREAIIKQIVDAALQKKFAHKKLTFDDVYISACVGVRGRAQMISGFFKDNRYQDGLHMNAYIKCAGETHLTHWEPRKGPQSFFNDTVCAVVVSLATSLFEHKVRKGEINSSKVATTEILKSKTLKRIVSEFLNAVSERYETLLGGVKNEFNPKPP